MKGAAILVGNPSPKLLPHDYNPEVFSTLTLQPETHTDDAAQKLQSEIQALDSKIQALDSGMKSINSEVQKSMAHALAAMFLTAMVVVPLMLLAIAGTGWWSHKALSRKLPARSSPNLNSNLKTADDSVSSELAIQSQQIKQQIADVGRDIGKMGRQIEGAARAAADATRLIGQHLDAMNQRWDDLLPKLRPQPASRKGEDSDPRQTPGAGVSSSPAQEEGETIRLAQDRRLRDLLAPLTQADIAGAGESIVNRLRQSLSRILEQPASSKESLWEHNDRVNTFAEQLKRLLESIPSHELQAKLEPLLNQARHLQIEIADLALAKANSVRVHFNVELYTSTANNQSLTDAVALGLKKQILKLDNPANYFENEFLNLTATAVVNAADTLDKNVDDARRNAGVQHLLDDLLNAGGIEQIAPSPGEVFRPAEHRSSDGGGRGSLVERLIERGFRRDGRLIRKAQVTVRE
jgi:molecular chaperone GrpE (heat shock protein)